MTASASTNESSAPELATAAVTREPWSVEKVAAAIPGGPPASGTESAVPFFHMLERLKTTKREGWRRFGIDGGESISDHMYRMSLITMFAPPSLASRVNIPHCMKMALIHDMAEALVGDITPMDKVPKAEKSRRESTTMDYFVQGLLGKVNGGMTGKEMKDIWQEYEDSKTLESQFVHDVDKVELVLQMFEYEKSNQGKIDLGEFSWVATKVQLPEVKQWCNEILTDREAFWAENGGRYTKYTDGLIPEKKILSQSNEYYGNGKQ